jgi:hypothetical protein
LSESSESAESDSRNSIDSLNSRTDFWFRLAATTSPLAPALPFPDHAGFILARRVAPALFASVAPLVSAQALPFVVESRFQASQDGD